MSFFDVFVIGCLLCMSAMTGLGVYLTGSVLYEYIKTNRKIDEPISVVFFLIFLFVSIFSFYGAILKYETRHDVAVQKAQMEGRKAFEDGLPVIANPYNDTTPKANWIVGWSKAYLEKKDQ